MTNYTDFLRSKITVATHAGFEVDEWSGCYPSNWKGIITPASFTHPAKFSSRLIQRIYQHMMSEGWLQPGAHVVDPFGGVALGALEAMRLGLDWTGVELEERFVNLGRENIDLWNTRFSGKLPRWGTAALLHGDSRRLAEVVSEAGGVVSSPPYADGFAHTGGDTPTSSEHIKGGTLYGVGINGVVSSPPYAGNDKRDFTHDERDMAVQGQGCFRGTYSRTPGQLGDMNTGDFQGAVSSPPFLQTQGGCNVTSCDGPLSDPRLIARHSAGNQAANAYGKSAGQLSELNPGDYRAAVSSPPFEATEGAHSANKFKDPEESARARSEGYASGRLKGHYASPEAILRSMQKANEQVYGETPGNMGNDSGETFWLAARLIIEQVYAVLQPGAHAAWVLKGFIKNKSYVDFPHQWQAVCEAVGFVTLHEHHAMLVKHNGTSRTFTGELIEHKTQSKSFFRRLAEKNGSPAIDWETVLCMTKPTDIIGRDAGRYGPPGA